LNISFEASSSGKLPLDGASVFLTTSIGQNPSGLQLGLLDRCDRIRMITKAAAAIARHRNREYPLVRDAMTRAAERIVL
jgi:hypothetical protein